MIGQASEGVLILAIESSCGEAATAVVRNGRIVLSNMISSQIAAHTVYGGVVPEIAPREHIKAVNYVTERALTEAQATPRDIMAINVIYEPSLIDTLLAGVVGVKAIAYAAGKPLTGVHHVGGHVPANFIKNQDLRLPFACLIVSGGRTHLVIIKNYGGFEVADRTRDGAAGEALDRVARSVGLRYPGGSKIDRTAKEESLHAIQFPRDRVERASYDPSSNGLKPAVLNHINHAHMTGKEIYVPDLTTSFQNPVVESLVSRATLAAHESRYKKLAMAGGVAFNSALRKAMAEACEKDGLQFYYPSLVFCTDDAATTGTAVYYEYLKGNIPRWDLSAIPNLKLGER